MINFVVVEDNINHRNKIKDIIIKYMMKNDFEFNIFEFSKYTQELNKIIKERECNHIYILDFELPNTNAIELARKIRENDWDSPIIVYTINGGMAYDTFKQRLQILDFVNKQYKGEENLIELFEICLKQFSLKNSLKFSFKGIDYSIDFHKILYIYRDTIERKCVVVTNKKEYKVLFNISDIIEFLSKDFVFSHKSCIVNISRIEYIDWKKNRIVFDNGKFTTMISRSRKKDLIQYVQ